MVSGLRRSTDSGDSWTLVSTALDFDGAGPTTLLGETIAFSRRSGGEDTVVAAGESMVAVSYDAGITWAPAGSTEGQRIVGVSFGPAPTSPADRVWVATFPDTELAALGFPVPNVPVSDPGSGGVFSGYPSGGTLTLFRQISRPGFGVANVSGAWSWTIPYDPTAVADWRFQVSDDLSSWTDYRLGDPGVAISAGRIDTMAAGRARPDCCRRAR